jgi:general L-amino acid transport system permease protein
MSSSPSLSSSSNISFFRNEKNLKILAQIISTIAVVGFLSWAFLNFITISEERGLSLSYNFLELEAGFPISDPGIPYTPADSYATAFKVGLANTLRIAIPGIFFAVTIGILVALSRLSKNWLLSKLALMYIEFHRNIPLLVLLIFWYKTLLSSLPRIDDAININNRFFFHNRGFFLSWPRLTEKGSIFGYSIIIGLILFIYTFIVLRKKREITGIITHHIQKSFGVFLLSIILGLILTGESPYWIDIPIKGKFNYVGGYFITPEFTGMLVALITYTSAFMAEVVRAGIQAVDKGQIEAAKAIGLKQGQFLSLIVLPQALRIIIPPMISQFLNLTKNTSLALAIGYQDIFSVGMIAINQSGRAVPAFSIVMLIYLSLSLLVSAVLNMYNKRIQFITR